MHKVNLFLITLLTCFIYGCSSGNSSASINNTTPIRTVTSFGAIGDGVTDDTQALQNALDWVSKYNGNLIFPDGTYITNLMLTVSPLVMAELTGIGNATIKLRDNSSINDPLQKAILQVGNTNRIKVGPLLNNAVVATNRITINENNNIHLQESDNIIIAEDKPQIGNVDIRIQNPNYSESTELDTTGAFFTPEMVGKSVVFNLNTMYLKDVVQNEPIRLKMNEPVQGAIVYITQVISTTKAIGFVGNNNNPSSFYKSGSWGVLEVFDPARGYYIKGEIRHIKAINGQNIVLSENLRDSYNAANTNIYQISNGTLKMSNLNFVGASTNSVAQPFAANYGLLITDINNFIASNINISNVNQIGLFLSECANSTMSNVNTYGIPMLNSKYSFLIASSQNILLQDADLSSGSHAFASGGTFPVDHVTLKNVKIEDGAGGANYAFDFHGNSMNVNLDNVTSLGGFVYVGKNLSITNSKFRSSINGNTNLAARSIVLWPEVSSDYYTFSNVTLLSDIRPAFEFDSYNILGTLNSDGISFGSITNLTFDNVNIKSNNSSAVQIDNGVSIPEFKNITINNSTINSDGGVQIGSTNNIFGPPPTAPVRIDNLTVSNSTINTLTTTNPGFNVQVISGNYNTGVTINNNTIENSNLIGMNFAGISDLTIINNSLNGNSLTKNLNISNYENLAISNNVFIRWLNISTVSDLNDMLNSPNINSNLPGASFIDTGNTVSP